MISVYVSYPSQSFLLLTTMASVLCNFISVLLLSCKTFFSKDATPKSSHCCEFVFRLFNGIIIAVEQLEGTFVVLFFLSLATLLRVLVRNWVDRDLGTDVVFFPASFWFSSVWRKTSTIFEWSFCLAIVFSMPIRTSSCRNMVM